MAGKKIKITEFTEKDEDFIKQLARDIGCDYSKSNERTYNLNKCDAKIGKKLGIFAWVHKEDDFFWIATRKTWIEEARSRAQATGVTAALSCFINGIENGDSVSFNTKSGYEKTVKALTLVCQAC